MVTPRVADAALAAGIPEMALHVADILLEKDPHDVRALIEKGNALYAMRDMAGAAVAYRTALAVDPRASAAGLGLGRALIRTDPSGAEAAFLGVTTQEPGNMAAWNDIGIARDLQGHHDDAQFAYRRALAVSPEADDITGNLGLSLAVSGHAAEAVALLRPLATVPDAPQNLRDDLEVAQMAPNVSAPARPGATPVLPRTSLAAVAPAAPPSGRPPITATEGGSSVRNRAAVQPPNTPRMLSPAAVAAMVRAIPAENVMAAVDSPFVVPAIAGAQRPVVAAEATNAPDGARVIPRDGQGAGAPPVNAEAFLPTNGTAGVQLAAYGSERRAWTAWDEWHNRLGSLLAPWKPTITAIDVQGRTLWRLRIEGVADTKTARALCSSLLAGGWPDCWAISGQGRRANDVDPGQAASIP